MDLATVIVWIIPIAGIAAILFAIYLARDVLRRDTGTDAMREVAGTITRSMMGFPSLASPVCRNGVSLPASMKLPSA